MPLTTLSAAVEDLLVHIEERVKAGGVDLVGLSSGFPNFDKATGGLRKKAVYVFGGRPGMGKSSFALAVAIANARDTKKVLFLTMEMSSELFALRALSSLTGIPAERIERGRLSKEEFETVQAVREDIDKVDFMILDDSVHSEQFISFCTTYQEEHGLDLLIIDYASLFRDENKFGDNERMGRISSNVMSISNQCNIPVCMLVQLNRQVEQRENHVPILSDIRDSGSIEQDAFLVAFMYRPHYYAMMFDGEEPVLVEKDAKIIIAKNRQGEVGQLNAFFYPNRMQWSATELKGTQPPPTGLGPLAQKVREGRTLV